MTIRILRILWLLFMGFLLASLVSCTDDSSETKNSETVDGTFIYTVIDGMPCLIREDGFGAARTSGLSCDWTKWKGNLNELPQ